MLLLLWVVMATVNCVSGGRAATGGGGGGRLWSDPCVATVRMTGPTCSDSSAALRVVTIV